MLGHIEKTPTVSVICTAVKVEILFQDFAYNLDTLILQYILQWLYFHKANNKNVINLYQTTKHTIDATEKSVENVNEMPF